MLHRTGIQAAASSAAWTVGGRRLAWCPKLSRRCGEVWRSYVGNIKSLERSSHFPRRMRVTAVLILVRTILIIYPTHFCTAACCCSSAYSATHKQSATQASIWLVHSCCSCCTTLAPWVTAVVIFAYFVYVCWTAAVVAPLIGIPRHAQTTTTTTISTLGSWPQSGPPSKVWKHLLLMICCVRDATAAQLLLYI